MALKKNRKFGLQKTISVFLLISFLSFALPFNGYSEDLFNSQQNQADLIPVSGSSGLSQNHVDQKNGVNSLILGGPAEPSAPKAIVQPTAPIQNQTGINLGFADIFKMIILALGKTALPVPPLALSGNEDAIATTVLPNKDFLGRPITYQVTKQPANGTVLFLTDPTMPDKVIMRYTPKNNFNGKDSFEYKSITPSNGLSSESAVVSIDMKSVNDEPVIENPNFVFDHALGHTMTGSLGSATDADGETLQYAITKNLDPAVGTVTYNAATKTITIVPGEQCEAGVFDFNYSVSDGKVTKNGIAHVEMKNCDLDDDHHHDTEIGATFDLHGDVMPNFADEHYARFADGTLRNIISVADSGKLSDILKTHTIGAEDVLILTGEVLFDVPELNVNTLALYPGAHLKFATDMNTRLKTINILVTEGSHLEIGSADHPIAEAVKAEIVFKDQPLNTALDPLQFGNGLVAFGKVTMHGRELKETFVRTAAEPLKGATTITSSGSLEGWKVGDAIEIPDTRQLTDYDREKIDPNTGVIVSQTERRTIVKIEGQKIYLDKALDFDHKGALNMDNIIEFLPHVINLTRNIVLHSENPSGTRGHTLYTHEADVDIEYAGFEDLGRTLNTPLNNTKLNADGSVKSVGTNQIGRYSIHFHHLVGTAQPDGYQYTLIGAAVVQNLAKHDFKWGIAIHNSHFGLISQNVVFNPRGAGIVTEDGSETGNVIEKNIVMQSTGSGDRGDGRMGNNDKDLGHDGVGFWFRGTNNIIRDNVAVDIHGKNDNSHFGFKFFPYFLGDVKIPKYKGADTSIAGQYTLTDSNSLPITEFSNNEVYAAAGGMTYWWVGMMFETPREGPPTYITGFKLWNIYGIGFFHYPAANIVIDNLVMIGDRTHPNGSAWSGEDYGAYNITIQNSRIEGMAMGIKPSTRTAGGLQIFKNLIMSNLVDFSMSTVWTSGSNAEILEPRTVIIDNVKSIPIPGQTHQFIEMKLEGSTGRTSNQMVSDRLFVKNYNQIQGVDFQVYYKEQLAEFVPEPTIFSMYGAFPTVVASPEAGLTNQQLMQKYGQAIAGAVAPCADSIVGIGGIVCGQGKAFQDLLSPIPVVFDPVYKVYKNDKGKFDVVVNWYTNKESDSSIGLKTSAWKAVATLTDNTPTKVHSIVLKDLDPGQMYYYSIASKNSAGTSKAGDYLSITLPGVDPTKDTKASEATDIAVGVFNQAAQIRWRTNEWTLSSVEYGLDANYGQTMQSNFYTASEVRGITLQNLQAGAVYHYRIKNVDAAGNISFSADKTFTVPILKSPATQSLFENDVTLTYEIPSRYVGARFYYVVDGKTDQPEIADADGNGNVVLKGLSPGPHKIKGRLMIGKTEVEKTAFTITVFVK